MWPQPIQKHAIWALTPKGAALGEMIRKRLPYARLFVSAALAADYPRARPVERLKTALAAQFREFDGHICIMAAGIVVRLLAPLLVHKTEDPAVVVMDEQGAFAVSLLSGHIGGANDLALEMARLTGARPVITTATDVGGKPAVDILAKRASLGIANPRAIKAVNMALVAGKKPLLYDPGNTLGRVMAPGEADCFESKSRDPWRLDGPVTQTEPCSGVWVHDRVRDLPDEVLVLRPLSLIAGMGCNRNTPLDELRDLLFSTLDKAGLARECLAGLASIDAKLDEPGLLELAAELGLGIRFCSREELNDIKGIKSPSAVVAKHMGVSSVCEAAALAAAGKGRLIVPKKKTPNVTVAIARIGSMWSASAPGIPPIFPGAPGGF